MDKKGKLLYRKIKDDPQRIPRSYSMPESMIDLLRHLAEREDVSASQIVRRSVQEFIFNNYIADSNRQILRE